jgi:drug/metabolite transporter (DMT)-like permease
MEHSLNRKNGSFDAVMQRNTAIPAAAHSHRAAYLLLAGVVVLWGANWPVMKLGLAELPPFWFAAIRVILGALCLFAVLALGGNLALPGRRDTVQLLGGGILQVAVYMGLVNLALVSVAPGRAAVLAYTTPLWAVPGAMLFLGERMGALKAAGLVLGFGGVVVLFNPLGFDWSDRQQVMGNLMLMGAAFAWAAAIMLIRGRPWHLTPLQLAPWQLLLAGGLLLAAAYIGEGPLSVHLTPKVIAILAYNGPVCISFCFWASVAIARALPAVTSSLSFLAVPAFGIAASAVVLGERIDLTLIGGFALILAGVVLVAAADRRAR